jgi:hypothetical protein
MKIEKQAAKWRERAQIAAAAEHRLLLDAGRESMAKRTLKKTREMTYRASSPNMFKESNEPGNEHNEISMKGQENQTQHPRRNSIDHAGNLRMIENTAAHW